MMEVNIWGLLGWTLYMLIMGVFIIPLCIRVITTQIFRSINESKIEYITSLEQVYKTPGGETNGEK